MKYLFYIIWIHVLQIMDMQFIWLDALICLCFVENLWCLLEIEKQMERGGISVIAFILYFVIRFFCCIIQISEKIVAFWLTAKGIYFCGQVVEKTFKKQIFSLGGVPYLAYKRNKRQIRYSKYRCHKTGNLASQLTLDIKIILFDFSVFVNTQSLATWN